MSRANRRPSRARVIASQREELLAFQSVAVALMGGAAEARHLSESNWDMLRVSSSWESCTDEEFVRALRLFGPAAYRVVRWSHLPEMSGDVHMLGGSCLLTSGDSRAMRKDASIDVVSLIDRLPSLPQVSDGLLGISCPDARSRRLLYVSEDALFAQRVLERDSSLDASLVQGQLAAEGERARVLSQSLAESVCEMSFDSVTVGYGALDSLIDEGMTAFLQDDRFVRSLTSFSGRESIVAQLMRSTSRTRVMYSYTQHFFEQVLCRSGLTDTGAQWVIAEPFHHFSRMPQTSLDTRCSKKRVGVMYQGCVDYFAAEPYGVAGSQNERICLVATLPAVTGSGLAFRDETTDVQPSRQNVFAYLARLRDSWQNTPLSTDHPLIVAGVNYGWMDPRARALVVELFTTAQAYAGAMRLVKKSLPKGREVEALRRSIADDMRFVPSMNVEIRSRLHALYDIISKRLERLLLM